MSAAEAGRTGDVGPDLPVSRRRLRVAAPAPEGEGADGPESLFGTEPGLRAGRGGDAGRAWLAAAEVRSTQVRVREVRVVRRAGAVRRSSGLVPGPAGAATGRAQAAAARATQTRIAAQRRTVTQGRVMARSRTATRRPQRPGAIRLTRRGRWVVAGFAMLLVVVAATVLWMTMAGSVQASSQSGSPASPYQGMTQVVVRPGQTLWSIAAAAEPSANTWTVIQQITEVNALGGATVHPGQMLWVPKG
ncbi:MAG TPA: LysM peptidoglycan-binding domain-containing protein [Streptosporangiaceae bacterium]|nr:LysM peptidoglycan-binding domain-containing protein [Streptosporangiaceae bacterium]